MPEDDAQYLPKEPLDLPKPPLDLPREPKELPEHLAQSTAPLPFKGPHASSEVKTLLTWQAPGRPFRMRDRTYVINILILMLIVEVILFLFSQYLLMLVVVSLVFVNYALTTVPPHDFRYKITTEGIMVEDHFYLWQELYDFYFKKREGVGVLIVRTQAFVPGELVITLGDIHAEHVKTVLLPYLPYREYVPPTSLEKAGEWLSRTFPLERKPV